jgi:hypothetical protein
LTWKNLVVNLNLSEKAAKCDEESRLITFFRTYDAVETIGASVPSVVAAKPGIQCLGKLHGLPLEFILSEVEGRE